MFERTALQSYRYRYIILEMPVEEFPYNLPTVGFQLYHLHCYNDPTARMHKIFKLLFEN
jgi:hypothetical protein